MYVCITTNLGSRVSPGTPWCKEDEAAAGLARASVHRRPALKTGDHRSGEDFVPRAHAAKTKRLCRRVRRVRTRGQQSARQGWSNSHILEAARPHLRGEGIHTHKRAAEPACVCQKEQGLMLCMKTS